MDTYLSSTPLLDYQNPVIAELIGTRGWNTGLSKSERISAIYAFVRDEIRFTFPERADIPASQVLADQSGNSLTKSTLFMALLRGVGIPCRMEPVLIDRSLFSGTIAKWLVKFVPKHLYHTSVSIRYRNTWVRLGGFSIDRPYIESLQKHFSQYTGSFYRYGLATLHFRNPYIVWDGVQTYNYERPRSTSAGIYSDPDSFYRTLPRAAILCSGVRCKLIRNHANRRILAIRAGTFFPN